MNNLNIKLILDWAMIVILSIASLICILAAFGGENPAINFLSTFFNAYIIYRLYSNRGV